MVLKKRFIISVGSFTVNSARVFLYVQEMYKLQRIEKKGKFGKSTLPFLQRAAFAPYGIS